MTGLAACHYCRRRKAEQELVACKGGRPTFAGPGEVDDEEQSRCIWCFSCISKHLEGSSPIFLQTKSASPQGWLCPRCRGCCPCGRCRPKTLAHGSAAPTLPTAGSLHAGGAVVSRHFAHAADSTVQGGRGRRQPPPGTLATTHDIISAAVATSPTSPPRHSSSPRAGRSKNGAWSAGAAVSPPRGLAHERTDEMPPSRALPPSRASPPSRALPRDVAAAPPLVEVSPRRSPRLRRSSREGMGGGGGGASSIAIGDQGGKGGGLARGSTRGDTCADASMGYGGLVSADASMAAGMVAPWRSMTAETEAMGDKEPALLAGDAVGGPLNSPAFSQHAETTRACAKGKEGAREQEGCSTPQAGHPSYTREGGSPLAPLDSSRRRICSAKEKQGAGGEEGASPPEVGGHSWAGGMRAHKRRRVCVPYRNVGEDAALLSRGDVGREGDVASSVAAYDAAARSGVAGGSCAGMCRGAAKGRVRGDAGDPGRVHRVGGSEAPDATGEEPTAREELGREEAGGERPVTGKDMVPASKAARDEQVAQGPGMHSVGSGERARGGAVGASGVTGGSTGGRGEGGRVSGVSNGVTRDSSGCVADGAGAGACVAADGTGHVGDAMLHGAVRGRLDRWNAGKLRVPTVSCAEKQPSAAEEHQFGAEKPLVANASKGDCAGGGAVSEAAMGGVAVGGVASTPGPAGGVSGGASPPRHPRGRAVAGGSVAPRVRTPESLDKFRLGGAPLPLLLPVVVPRQQSAAPPRTAVLGQVLGCEASREGQAVGREPAEDANVSGAEATRDASAGVGLSGRRGGPHRAAGRSAFLAARRRLDQLGGVAGGLGGSEDGGGDGSGGVGQDGARGRSGKHVVRLDATALVSAARGRLPGRVAPGRKRAKGRAAGSRTAPAKRARKNTGNVVLAAKGRQTSRGPTSMLADVTAPPALPSGDLGARCVQTGMTGDVVAGKRAGGIVTGHGVGSLVERGEGSWWGMQQMMWREMRQAPVGRVLLRAPHWRRWVRCASSIDACCGPPPCPLSASSRRRCTVTLGSCWSRACC
eukprot:jgi/Mesvir1/27857/Mv07526-RA.1